MARSVRRWYIDMKEQSGCQSFNPYTKAKVKDLQGCQDRIVLSQSGTVKPGLAVQETITLANDDEPPMVITREVTELKKGPLAAELFNAPADYKQVSTTMDLYRGPVMPQAAQSVAPGASVLYAPPQGNQRPNVPNMPSVAQMMNPATLLAMQQQMMAGPQPMDLGGTGMFAMGGMPRIGAPQGSTPVAAPQALRPKAAGKIRIGVAPPDAQVGQGNNAGADYSTPIRNVMVALMNGPAVEVAALDARVPVQLQAEAQQKECDLILYSKVIVKHNSGGFGKLMKMAAPVASVVPIVGMSGSIGSGCVSRSYFGAAVSRIQWADQVEGRCYGAIPAEPDRAVFPQAAERTCGQGQVQRRRRAYASSDAGSFNRPDRSH